MVKRQTAFARREGRGRELANKTPAATQCIGGNGWGSVYVKYGGESECCSQPNSMAADDYVTRQL